MKGLFSCIIGLLICAVALLQREINDLKGRLRQADQRTAAAIEKFESDLLAKLRADEKTRLAAQILADAQRKAAINEGLRHLPTGDLNKPALWGALPK
jgi:hypothetical protein